MTDRKSFLHALFIASIVAFASLRPSVAHADVPPGCSGFDADITCDQADVGKPCQGGGQCYDVACNDGVIGPIEHRYKCEICPPVLDSPLSSLDGSTICSPAGIGTACGDGGMCGVVPSYCLTGKFACVGQSSGRPTGPPLPSDAAAPDSATEGGASADAARDSATAPDAPSNVNEAGGTDATGGTGSTTTSTAGTTPDASATGVTTGTTTSGSATTTAGTSTTAAMAGPAVNSGCACSTGPRSDNRGMLALIITAAGAVFLLADRRRRLHDDRKRR